MNQAWYRLIEKQENLIKSSSNDELAEIIAILEKLIRQCKSRIGEIRE